MSERIAQLMKEKKNLNANVDFYSATVYYSLGIPTDLFTPVFAIARCAGWCAHVLEQLEDNRLYRPLSEYIGEPAGKKVVPIDERPCGRRSPGGVVALSRPLGAWRAPLAMAWSRSPPPSHPHCGSTLHRVSVASDERGSKTRGRETLALLRAGPFRRYLIGTSISDTGTWMQIMAQGWIMSTLTDKAIMLGMVNFAAGLPMFSSPCSVAPWPIASTNAGFSSGPRWCRSLSRSCLAGSFLPGASRSGTSSWSRDC